MSGDVENEVRASDPPLPVLVGPVKVKKKPNLLWETVQAIVVTVGLIFGFGSLPPANGGLNSFSRYGGMVLLSVGVVLMWLNMSVLWRKNRKDQQVDANGKRDAQR